MRPAGGMCPERFEWESNIPGEDLGNGEYRASAQGLTKSWRQRRTSAHVQAGIDSCYSTRASALADTIFIADLMGRLASLAVAVLEYVSLCFS